MSVKQSNRWQVMPVVLSGGLLPISWIVYFISASDIACWAVIAAHLLSVFVGYWILVNQKQGNKRVERISFGLIIIGNVAIAGSMFDTLFPISSIAISIVATIGWLTFPMGYSLFGLSLLRTKSNMRWVGIAFLFSLAALFIALIGREWTLMLAAIVLGMTGIGLGYILLGIGQYFGRRSTIESEMSNQQIVTY